MRKYTEKEEHENQDIELFAERVRDHILKEHFLNTLDQHTPQKKAGLAKPHPKSDFLVKLFKPRPTKFVDQNNMRISAFHTSVIQGKGSARDSEVLLKKETSPSVHSKPEGPGSGLKESGLTAKTEGRPESRLENEGELEKSTQKNDASQIRIELGNMEKELYSKMEQMQIAHKEKVNEIILEKKRVVDKMEGDRQKLEQVLPVFGRLKKSLSYSKKCILRRVEETRQELGRRISGLRREEPEPVPMDIFEACEYVVRKTPKHWSGQSQIVSHINLERQKQPETQKADVITQTGQRRARQDVSFLPHFDYRIKRKKRSFQVDDDPQQSYNYHSSSWFDSQLGTQCKEEPASKHRYKFRNRKRLENKIIDKIVVLDKENEQSTNQPVGAQSLLGKREDVDCEPNSKQRFVNSKSILNLNKIFGRKCEDQPKDISEFPVYPKRKKKRRRRVAFDCFQNSVRITNLVGEKGRSAQTTKPETEPRETAGPEHSGEEAESKQLVGKECMAAFLNIKKV